MAEARLGPGSVSPGFLGAGAGAWCPGAAGRWRRWGGQSLRPSYQFALVTAVAVLSPNVSC